MLNRGLKAEHSRQLEVEIEKYNQVQSDLVLNSENLYKERKRMLRQLDRAYTFINKLRHVPEEIIIKVEKIKINLQEFSSLLSYSEKQFDQKNLQVAVSGSTGVAAGAAIAGFAPSVAMGVATTFGVASTGTAISTLSGAAATKAALAWIGGGALTAGGGGIAAGNALLALAGPIGWTIGGVGLLGSALSISGNNKKAAVHAMANEASIRGQHRAMSAISTEIDKMSDLTQKNKHGIRVMLDNFDVKNIDDYLTATKEDRYLLGAFVNNVLSSTELLNGVIGESGKFVDNNGVDLLKDDENKAGKFIKKKYDKKELYKLIVAKQGNLNIHNQTGSFASGGPIESAIKNLAPDITASDIVLFYNQSFGKKMKKGFIITKEELIVNQSFGKPYRVDLKSIYKTASDASGLIINVIYSEPRKIDLMKDEIAAFEELLQAVIYYLKTHEI